MAESVCKKTPIRMTTFRSDHPFEPALLLQQSQKRIGGSAGVSAVLHAIAVGIALWVAHQPGSQTTLRPPSQNFLNKDIVWLDIPGPGGGGGGGGNRSPEAPRKVELKGADKISVPAVKPPSMTPTREETTPPVQQLAIPAQTMASANLELPGAMDGAPAATASRGNGTGGGAGTGNGTGDGPGSGPGLGDGSGGNAGGGVFQPGNGIVIPRLLREVKPQYTAEAMRAKIQGTVLLECVIQADGTVGKITVRRSLDPAFGLDQEAAKAARQWQFAPGTRQGRPVAVLVTIAIDFWLR